MEEKESSAETMASDDYVVFEEYSAEVLLKKMKAKKESKPKAKPKANPKAKPNVQPKQKTKALLLQEKMASGLHKPNSGLHRSLSKIIAEDQEALKNRKSHLDSLFSDDK